MLPKSASVAPIYVDVANILNKEKPSNESEKTRNDVFEDNAVESDDEGNTKGRFEWGVGLTRKLLCVINENKEDLFSSTNKKFVWQKIANTLCNERLDSDKCRERFYTLKKGYRKYLTESKKTGNKRVKPFLFEVELSDILDKDPTFTPVCAKGSAVFASASKSDLNCDIDEHEDDQEPPNASPKENAQTTPSRKRKSQIDDLKEFLEERDQKFLKTIEDITNKQNALLEKLIDKL